MSIKLAIPTRNNQEPASAEVLLFSSDTTVQTVSSTGCGEIQHHCVLKYPAVDDGGISNNGVDFGIYSKSDADVLNGVAACVYTGRSSVTRVSHAKLLKSARNAVRRMARATRNVEILAESLGICNECGPLCARCLAGLEANIEPKVSIAALNEAADHLEAAFDMRPVIIGCMIRGIAKAVVPSTLRADQRGAMIAHYLILHAVHETYRRRILKAAFAIASLSESGRTLIAKAQAAEHRRLWTFKRDPQELVEGNQR